MNIALIIGEIGYISHYRLIEGIKKRAKEEHSNIYLFTCEGFLYEHLDSYISGEYTIFDLPAIETYDGVIVDFTTIGDEAVVAALKKRVEAAEIPCVSINSHTQNADYIDFDNRTGFEELLRHIMDGHAIKDIVYLSGPVKNRDAIERKDILLDIANEYGVHIPDENIYYGDFNYESGRQFILNYLDAKKPLPQAFVAANDYMAVGIMNELMNRGIKIPEQVIVTGYDNNEIVAYTNPRMTTVDRREYEAGICAYDMLLQRIHGRAECEEYSVTSEFVRGASCGCSRESKEQSEGKYVEMCIRADGNLDLIKKTSLAFSNIRTDDALQRNIETIISSLEMEYFYFCQCGTRESYYTELDLEASGKQVPRDVSTYPETMWCPIAYEDGEWNSYSPFPTKDLFPTNSRYKKESSYYVIMPVHQGRSCIGYCIMGNFSEDLSGRVFQHLIINIDQAIGNKRRRDLMEIMLAKINRKWQYDELTDIYNRSGMNEKLQVLLEEAISQNYGMGVIFFDLNGLKQVNDIEGHLAGDQYIKSMANMLRDASEHKDIVCRYGGDEFLVIAKLESEAACQEKMAYLMKNIKAPVSASAGYAFGMSKSMQDVNRLISEADERMYTDKMKQKAKDKTR